MSDLAERFMDAKADYKAANRSSLFQRRRRGVPTMGASADYHYRDEADFLWMGEAARDIDRNDLLIGSIIDRAVDATLGAGFTPNPQTGDPALDRELLARWYEEAESAALCDPHGALCFAAQERLVLRDLLVAGEMFCLPAPNGQVDLQEFHRCRSPHRRSKTNDSIVHGIEYVEGTRRRLRYWFTKELVNPLKQVDRKDLVPRAAFDEAGDPLVWHVYRQQRVTQSRGITALAPIFDAVSMHDDIHFATLLKQQLSNFFLLVRSKKESAFTADPNAPPAGQQSAGTGMAPGGELQSRWLSGIRPGTEIQALDGETVTPWAPNIPNTEWFAHMRLVLQIIGVNLGVPLVMVLMDGSETNFSGYRGAIDQAREGFRANQRLLIRSFHRQYWKHRLNVWADGDPALAAARARVTAAKTTYFSHEWDVASWAYIEPTKDAMADLIRDANMLQSPRRRYAERSLDWETIVEETIEDRSLAISAALEKSKELNDTHQLEGDAAIRWRDLCPLPVPERVNISLTETGSNPAPTSSVPLGGQ